MRRIEYSISNLSMSRLTLNNQTYSGQRPMRVAVVEPVGGHGGMNYYDASLCRSLVSYGIAPTLYTSDVTSIPNANFEIRTYYKRIFGTDWVWRRGLRFLRGSVATFMHAWSVQSHVAHFHFFDIGPLQLMDVFLARLFGMKVIITAHDVESFKETPSVQRFVRWSYALASAVVAHNEISRTELIERIGIEPGKIHVIAAGNHEHLVDGMMERVHARKHLKLEDDEFCIVFFGHIKEVKGLDILLLSMPKFLERTEKRVRLVVAGRLWKQGFEGYQELIDRFNLAGRISLHIRYIPDEELPAFYRAADLMALPYRRIYQSDVALMALTFGTPVVASDIAGMQEMLQHMKTGILFESENSYDLAEKILWAIDHPAELAQISKNGRRLVHEKYSWVSAGEQLAALYRKMGR